MKLPKHNEEFLYSTSDYVRQVCQPLFMQSMIGYFDYHRFYPDGRCLMLTTHPEFHTEYLESELYITQQEGGQFLKYKKKITFMSELMPLPNGVVDFGVNKMRDNLALSKQFTIMHRLYFVSQEKDHFKLCGFGVTQDSPAIYEYFINSIDTMERFISYFEYQAYDLIEKNSRRNKVFLPRHLDAQPSVCTNYSKENLAYDMEFMPEKFHLMFNKKMTFTRREVEIMVLYVKGYSLKEIALKLAISPRTVENRLYRIKQAIGPVSKDKIRQTLVKKNILKLFDRQYL